VAAAIGIVDRVVEAAVAGDGVVAEVVAVAGADPVAAADRAAGTAGLGGKGATDFAEKRRSKA